MCFFLRSRRCCTRLCGLRFQRKRYFKLAAQLCRNIRLAVHIFYFGPLNGCGLRPPAAAQHLAQRVEAKGAAGPHLNMLALGHRHTHHRALHWRGRLNLRCLPFIYRLGNGFARCAYDLVKIGHDARWLALHGLHRLHGCRGRLLLLHRVGPKVDINIKLGPARCQSGLALFAGSAALIVFPLQFLAAAGGFLAALTGIGDMLPAAFHRAAPQLHKVCNADGERKINQQCQQDQQQDHRNHLAAEGGKACTQDRAHHAAMPAAAAGGLVAVGHDL